MSKYRLNISRDKTEAYLTITQDDKDDELSVDQVNEALRESGITVGIDHDTINLMIEHKQVDQKRLIAKGREAVPGKDGEIKYLLDFKSELTPTERENGSVDFFDLGLINNVLEGQHLARIIPPADGTPGENIYGEVIPAKRGKPVKLRNGNNTEFDKDDEAILKAITPGNAKLRGKDMIEVETVYPVEKDVSYRTGNIDFTGDVYIKGDVLSGFKVTATGDIVINGTVEDAEITAGGEIKIRGGFIGTGRGTATAGGDVTLGFIRNQHVVAGRDIIINKEAMNPTLFAERSIIMSGSNGLIAGGKASAKFNMTLFNVGNDSRVHTELSVAQKIEMIENKQKLAVELEDVEKRLKKIWPMLRKYRTFDKDIEMPEHHKKVFKTLEDNHAVLSGKERELKVNLKKIEEEIKIALETYYIRVKKSTHPGTVISMMGITHPIDRLKTRIVFRIANEAVVEFKE